MYPWHKKWTRASKNDFSTSYSFEGHGGLWSFGKSLVWNHSTLIINEYEWTPWSLRLIWNHLVPFFKWINFGLSEKHTKFEKIFLTALTNQLIYLVNVKTMRKIFSNYLCFSKSPNFKNSCTLHYFIKWYLHW